MPNTILVSDTDRARVVGLSAPLGNGVLVSTQECGVLFITKTGFPLAGPTGFASWSGSPTGTMTYSPFDSLFDLAVTADRSGAIDFFTATCNWVNGDDTGTIAHFDGRTLDPARMGTAASRIILSGVQNFLYGTLMPSVAALRGTDGTVRLFAQLPVFLKPSQLWVWDSASGPSLPAAKEMIDTGIMVDSVADVAAGASPRKLIAVSGGKLFEIWQNAADSPDDPDAWNQVEILLPEDAGLVKCVSHSSVVTFEDPHTGPLSNAKLTVSSADPIVLRTNGMRHDVGPQSSLVTALNVSGSIRLNTPATRLSSTTLVLTVTLADGTTASYDLDPSAPQLKRMLAMGDQGVATLVSNPANRAEVSNALERVNAVVSTFSSSLLQTLCTHQTDTPSTSSATELVPGSAWRFTVRDSQATFAPIDDQSFASAYASCDPASASGGFLDWLGDALEALSEVPAVVKFELAQVGETIQGWIEVAGEKLTVIADGAASFLDLCQTVLHAVETAWNAVVSYFGWLLSDAAGEIWQLHTTLKNALDSSAQTIGEQLDQAAPLLTTLLQSVVTGSGAWSQEAKNVPDVPAEEDVPCSSQPGLSGGTRELAADQSSVLNWIGEQIMSLLPTDGNLPTVNQDLLQPFINPFGNTTDQVKKDVQALVNYLSDTQLAELAMNNVTNKVAAVAGDLVEVIEAAVSSMLSGAGGLLTAIADVSTETISSPALRQIYNLLNPGAPEAPTMNGVVALMAAAPAVLFRRMAFENPKLAVSAAAGGPSAEGDLNVMLFTAGVYQVTLWNGLDVLLDLNRAAATKFMPPTLVWSLSITASSPLVAWTYPGLDKTDDLSIARFTAWVAGACNWVFNLAHILITRGTPARGSLYGSNGTAFLGILQLVALISTAIQTTERKGFQAPPWLALAGPLPAIAKVIPWWMPTTPPYVVPILDVAGNTAAGAAKIWASLPATLQTAILASTPQVQLRLDANGGMSG